MFELLYTYFIGLFEGTIPQNVTLLNYGILNGFSTFDIMNSVIFETFAIVASLIFLGMFIWLGVKLAKYLFNIFSGLLVR